MAPAISLPSTSARLRPQRCLLTLVTVYNASSSHVPVWMARRGAKLTEHHDNGTLPLIVNAENSCI